MKRTAIYHSHRALGARMTSVSDWELPDEFSSAQDEAAQVRSAAGLADVSHLAKLDWKGNDGFPTSQGTVWPLARGHALVTRDPALKSTECGHVTDVTSAYSALLLAGPFGRDILRKLTSLNVSSEALPDLAAAQASVAHVHTIVLRRDVASLPAFLLLTERPFGEYFWDAVLHAGHEFGIVPFGLKAQALLGVEI